MAIIDLRPELRLFLLESSDIFTAVGGARIFPHILPQGERRASLVYNLISEITDHHMQGASGLVTARYQLDAWAGLADDADALARLVKNRIDGYRGPMGAVQVQGVFADTAFTRYESNPNLYGVSRDFLIWYGER